MCIQDLLRCRDDRKSYEMLGLSDEAIGHLPSIWSDGSELRVEALVHDLWRARSHERVVDVQHREGEPMRRRRLVGACGHLDAGIFRGEEEELLSLHDDVQSRRRRASPAQACITQ